MQGEGTRAIGKNEVNLLAVSKVISARVKEILAHVSFQINLSKFDKKLIGGIVLTGGGSQLKHLAQLTELETGQSARLGLPKEHLASTKNADVESPIYATGIGLLIRAFKLKDEEALSNQGALVVEKPVAKEEIKVEAETITTPVIEETVVNISEPMVEEFAAEEEIVEKKQIGKRSLVSSWGAKLNNWIKSDIEDFDTK